MKAKTRKSTCRFIAIEGGEGSGKSSLILSLQEALGDKIFCTREPGGSPYAEVIRSATLKNPLAKTAPAETTLCLMFASRFDNVVNSIIPVLKSGRPVIADRFDASSYAYQICAQSNGALEDIFWKLRKRLAVIPDLYIFVDVDPKEGIRRANLRNQTLFKGKQYDHFDDREIKFHTAVRRGYRKFLRKVPHIIIDANRPLDAVKAEFIAQIQKYLGM
jgi:dTMP kinase